MRTLAAIFLLSLGAMAQMNFPPFSPDLSFYHSFDEGAEADLALGGEKVVWKSGTVHFAEGRRGGLALVCGKGGALLRFSRRGSLDFSRPGTIVVFYRPLGWEEQTKERWPRLFLWGIESNQGYIGLQGANDPKDRCMCERPFHLMLLYGKRLPNAAYSIPAPGKTGCAGWHFLAFTWAGAELSVKYDAQPPRHFSHPLPLQENDFPCTHFSIGSSSHWKYLLDDVIIYRRRLSPDELEQIRLAP